MSKVFIILLLLILPSFAAVWSNFTGSAYFDIDGNPVKQNVTSPGLKAEKSFKAAKFDYWINITLDSSKIKNLRLATLSYNLANNGSITSATRTAEYWNGTAWIALCSADVKNQNFPGLNASNSCDVTSIINKTGKTYLRVRANGLFKSGGKTTDSIQFSGVTLSAFSSSIGSSCITIDQNDTYDLTQNLAGATISANPLSGYTCIKIAASDVILNGNGYNLSNDDTGKGIVINQTVTNVSINSVNIFDYQNALHFYSAENSSITNVSISSVSSDVVLLDSLKNFSISYVSVNSSALSYYDGIKFTNSSNSTASFNTFFGSPNRCIITSSDSHDLNILSNTLLNCTSAGIEISSPNSTIKNNTLNDIGNSFAYGISINYGTPNVSVLSNRINRTKGYGISIGSTTDLLNLSNNIVIGSTYGGISADLTNASVQNNTIYDSLGIGFYSIRADYTSFSNNRFYNNSNANFEIIRSTQFNSTNDYVANSTSDFYYSTNSFGSGTYNISRLFIDNPNRNSINSTIISINDSHPDSSFTYTVSWAQQPSPFPGTNISFNGKVVKITDVSGSVNLDSVVFHWDDSELGSFDESKFILARYNGGIWNVMNDTPNTSENTLSLFGLNSFGYFAIMSSPVGSAYFTNPTPLNNSTNFNYGIIINVTSDSILSSIGNQIEIDGINKTCSVSVDDLSCSYALLYDEHLFNHTYVIRGYVNQSGSIIQSNETRYFSYFGCGIVNTNSTLISSISIPNSTCLTINSSNLLLNGNGFSISSAGNSGSGICIENKSNTNISSVSISGFSTGLLINQSTLSQIIDLSISSSYDSCYSLVSSSFLTINDSSASQCGKNGFVFTSSNLSNLINSAAINNSLSGIELTNSALISMKQIISSDNSLSGINSTSSIFSINQSNLTYNNYGLNSVSSTATMQQSMACFNIQKDIKSNVLTIGNLNKCDTFESWAEGGHLGCSFSCSQMWHRVFGNATTKAILRDNFTTTYQWSGVAGINIFFVDSDTTVHWDSLQALGRNIYNLSSSNDFIELDTNLGSSGYFDNVNRTYSTDGTNPISTETFTIFGRTINNVPISSSAIGNTTFKTGILWDTYSGGTDYTNHPVVFVVKINGSSNDLYGLE